MKPKGLPILVLTLVITLGLLSGCQNTPTSPSDAPALTMDQAMEINRAAHLLENYKTITYAQLDYIGGNTMHVTYFKDADGNCCVTEDNPGYTGYGSDGLTFSREKGKSAYKISATKEPQVSSYLFMVPGSEFTSQTTDANGNLVCKTQADISQDYADQLSVTWKATTEDKMITTTIFAADDFRVLALDFSLRRPDGSEEKIASGVMLYDQEVRHSDAVQGYLDADKATVSVKMEDSAIRTAEIPMGEIFSWSCDDGYALYLDKDGKTLIPEEADPVQNALTLYCLPKK